MRPHKELRRRTVLPLRASRGPIRWRGQLWSNYPRPKEEADARIASAEHRLREAEARAHSAEERAKAMEETFERIEAAVSAKILDKSRYRALNMGEQTAYRDVR
jgi:hypothetical protein